MCGITGFLDPRLSPNEAESVVEGMAASLDHRGPDADGVWIDAGAGVGLGFRRLAILDLTPQGAQPMESRDGRYVVVHNGEIYNFRTLRDHLEDRGYSFRGRSDTEVLLAAVDAWGVDGALERFVGMYAFALWDNDRGRLHLVRDRIGEKPLYYGRVGPAFVFASELEAIRRHPEADLRIDPEAFRHYVRHGYVPGALSIYKQIRKVPPGTHLTIRPGERQPEGDRYWSPTETARQGQANLFRGTPEAAVDELGRVLGDAVERCMVSDVPIGVFLSGGIDSSTVTALMQERSGHPVRSFTMGFPEGGYDEAPQARAIADHLGTDHTELYVTPKEGRAVVPDLPKIYDEPFADSSQIPTYLVSKLARDHVIVSLSGDGGDELFGGYRRHFMEEALFGRTDALPSRLRGWIGASLRLPGPEGWSRIAGVLSGLVGRFADPERVGGRLVQSAELIELGDPEARYRYETSLWGGGPLPTRDGDEPSPVDLPHVASDGNAAHRMMLADLQGYLPDDILVKVDRASMATSLESRAPLLNHDVVEFAWRLPLGWKVRGSSGKWILRKLLARHVPQDLFERPKMGFAVPIDRWLRQDLRGWARERLDPDLLVRQGFFDPAPVEEAWDQHQSGRADRHHELWTVLMFQAWLQEHHPERW